MQIVAGTRTFEILYSISVLNAMSKDKITVDEIKYALEQAYDQLYNIIDDEALVICKKNNTTLVVSVRGDNMTIIIASRKMPIL